MFYTSTRDKSVRVTAAEAIAKGISSEGGLFVPTEIPQISLEFIEKLVPMTYIERAKEVSDYIEKSGFEILEIRERRGWAAIYARRR
mgnify:CR=1 FL=1